MDDLRMIELLWARSESAVGEIGKKYGAYLHRLAFAILHSDEDAAECVSDAYLGAWNSIPPQRPGSLRAYLARLTRNFALKAYEKRGAQKRGGGETAVALDELGECVPSAASVEGEVLSHELTELLNAFLASLPDEKRSIFLLRYWYLRPVADIARELRMSESKVKMSLLRTREKLREALEKEDYLL